MGSLKVSQGSVDKRVEKNQEGVGWRRRGERGREDEDEEERD